jgi:hypothetical protein
LASPPSSGSHPRCSRSFVACGKRRHSPPRVPRANRAGEHPTWGMLPPNPLGKDPEEHEGRVVEWSCSPWLRHHRLVRIRDAHARSVGCGKRRHAPPCVPRANGAGEHPPGGCLPQTPSETIWRSAKRKLRSHVAREALSPEPRFRGDCLRRGIAVAFLRHRDFELAGRCDPSFPDGHMAQPLQRQGRNRGTR